MKPEKIKEVEIILRAENGTIYRNIFIPQNNMDVKEFLKEATRMFDIQFGAEMKKYILKKVGRKLV